MAEKDKNNNTETKPEGDKNAPSPTDEKKETAEERAIREKKEAEKTVVKVAEAERQRQIDEHYANAAQNVFSGTTSSDNIKVGDHIKHINLTLPEMKMTPVGCKVDRGLESIMTEDIKQEFNTYNYFGIFDSFDDMYVPSYDENGREIFEGKDTINAQTAGIKNNGVPNNRKKTQNGYKVTTGSPAVRSLFNRAGQVLIGNLNIDKNKNKELYWKAVRNTASEWRVALNVPLMDSPTTRKRIREHSGCTVAELVAASKAGDLGRAKYSYADFMYCKYLGRISNNYLITLRRFPIPPGDCITTSGTGKTRSSGRRGTRKMEGESQATEDMGCLVTWLGTPGNDMNNVLKYSVTMPFEEKEAGWEDIQVDGDSSQGFLPSIASAFNDSYRQQYCAGYGGTAFNSWVGKFFGGQASGYDAKSFANFRDKNKIYGPVDVVKKIYKRSENGGLDFKQNITIVFDYELRSYNGINPRQAMLDLISNILNVTYTSGGWWGGGYRGGGMAQSSIFTNLNIFKFDGTFTGFCDSLQKDYQTLTANLASQVQSAGGVLQYCLKLLNNIGGMLMGGLLNKMGRPARAMMHSLLSEQPVGFWHLMVGNPHHPIMSVGNMILKNTTIEHYGSLGLDDFPTGLKVTCELDRGKPRDNREVEKMYMNGNDRIYSSIGPKIADMYQKAAQYKAELFTSKDKDVNGLFKKPAGKNLEQNILASQTRLKQYSDTLKQNHADILDVADMAGIDTEEYENNLLYMQQEVENCSVVGSKIEQVKETSNVTSTANAWAKAYYDKNITIPCTQIFSVKDGDNIKYYTTTFIPKKENQKEFDANYNMILTPYPDENSQYLPEDLSRLTDSEIIIDASYNEFDKAIDDLGSDKKLEELLKKCLTEVGTSQSNINIYRKNANLALKEMAEHNEELTHLRTNKMAINTQIQNTDKQLREDQELLYISNRLQEMTSNLDSWNGDDLWKKFTGEEQIQILSKLADTDWYNLLYNWFGQTDLYSISLAAQEIEYGSYKKKDTELKTYNPDKVEIAQASVTMLKNVFDRHDWSDGAMDVSVNHVDGNGNIHKLYVQVDEKEQNGFLEAYKKYLESGDLSDISKYIDNKVEKEKSFTSIDGKVQDLDINKVIAIKPKDPPAPSAPPNDADPNAPNGQVNVGAPNVQTGGGNEYNPNGLEGTSYHPKTNGLDKLKQVTTKAAGGKDVTFYTVAQGDGKIEKMQLGGKTVNVNITLLKALASVTNTKIQYSFTGGHLQAFGTSKSCTNGPDSAYSFATGFRTGGTSWIRPGAAGWWRPKKYTNSERVGLHDNKHFRRVAQCDSSASSNRFMTKIAWPGDVMTLQGNYAGGGGSSHGQMYIGGYSGFTITSGGTRLWYAGTSVQQKEWIYGGGGRRGHTSAQLWRSNDIYPI